MGGAAEHVGNDGECILAELCTGLGAMTGLVMVEVHMKGASCQFDCWCYFL